MRNVNKVKFIKKVEQKVIFIFLYK